MMNRKVLYSLFPFNWEGNDRVEFIQTIQNLTLNTHAQKRRIKKSNETQDGGQRE